MDSDDDLFTIKMPIIETTDETQQLQQQIFTEQIDQDC
jgi:hypothetical protein